MTDEELLRKKKSYDKRISKNQWWNGYHSYIKHRRKLNIVVPEYENKIEERLKNMNSEFKLRKQYSKNYQVVELEVQGKISEYDVLVDWLDQKLGIEMQNLPQELLVKDNAGAQKKTPNHWQNKETKTPQQYNQNRGQYNRGATQPNIYEKPFGSPKQWAIIQKNEKRLLEEFGTTPDDIVNKEQLAEAIGNLMNS